MGKQLENEVTRSRRSHHEEVIKKIKTGVAVQTAIGFLSTSASVLALMPVVRDHTAHLFYIIGLAAASTTTLMFIVFGGLKQNQYAHQSYYKEPPAKSTDSGKITQPQNLQTGGVDSVDNFDHAVVKNNNDNNNSNTNNNIVDEHNHTQDGDNNKNTDVSLLVLPTTSVDNLETTTAAGDP
jgi:hypothetical protein